MYIVLLGARFNVYRFVANSFFFDHMCFNMNICCALDEKINLNELSGKVILYRPLTRMLPQTVLTRPQYPTKRINNCGLIVIIKRKTDA